ncbi:MAG: pyridoxal phosphate enzyme (YggS family) [Gammaproteobacteria bacterium]|jgi:PLP dependent protein
MQFIAQQLNIVREKVRAFEAKYGREENSVKLLAVSKTRSVEDILQAMACGQLEFGENYQQEASIKVNTSSLKNVVWHFIGPLQTNKAPDIAKHFSWIHSVDRIKIAQRLSALRPPEMPELNVCIQLNISQEASKSGAASSELISLAEEISSFPGLRLRGLMALPAPTNDFAKQREGFCRLREHFDQLKSAGYNVDTLSMGTSNDLEAAIAEGATIVRIGTALFGERK